MTPEQEKKITAIAAGHFEKPSVSYPCSELQAIAQVVLELAAKDRNPAFLFDHTQAWDQRTWSEWPLDRDGGRDPIGPQLEPGTAGGGGGVIRFPNTAGGWSERFVAFPDTRAILTELADQIERQKVTEYGNQYDAGFNYGIRRAVSTVTAVLTKLPEEKSEFAEVDKTQRAPAAAQRDNAELEPQTRVRVRDQLALIISEGHERMQGPQHIVDRILDRIDKAGEDYPYFADLPFVIKAIRYGNVHGKRF